MARYQIILAYDGTGFVGSQRQASTKPGGKARVRTVQGELESGLRKLGWTGRSVLMAGRTDTGVHASGQVAAFDFEWGHGLDDLRNALNANLAGDIVVREVKVVPQDFHPRFDATSRRYRYVLFCACVRDPLRERFAWQVWPPVSDLEPLARLWLGTHDFAAFGTPPRTGGGTVRTVISAEWRHEGDEWTFEIQADGFLYHMVRRLVAVQVAVGQGRLAAEALARVMESRQKVPAGLAPPNGLTLAEIRYDNLV